MATCKYVHICESRSETRQHTEVVSASQVITHLPAFPCFVRELSVEDQTAADPSNGPLRPVELNRPSTKTPSVFAGGRRMCSKRWATQPRHCAGANCNPPLLRVCLPPRPWPRYQDHRRTRPIPKRPVVPVPADFPSVRHSNTMGYVGTSSWVQGHAGSFLQKKSTGLIFFRTCARPNRLRQDHSFRGQGVPHPKMRGGYHGISRAASSYARYYWGC